LSELLIRTAVVEDFEPFRRFIWSTLKNRTGLRVICELADGLEAVEQISQLRPDLVLLDIGLPGLDGINVAREIRCRSPKTKILFLTLESSAGMIKEALSNGASAYVLKIDARRELITAIDAVLQGKLFLSSSISNHCLPEHEEKHTASSLQQREVVVPHP